METYPPGSCFMSTALAIAWSASLLDLAGILTHSSEIRIRMASSPPSCPICPHVPNWELDHRHIAVDSALMQNAQGL